MQVKTTTFTHLHLCLYLWTTICNLWPKIHIQLSVVLRYDVIKKCYIVFYAVESVWSVVETQHVCWVKRLLIDCNKIISLLNHAWTALGSLRKVNLVVYWCRTLWAMTYWHFCLHAGLNSASSWRGTFL